MSFVFLILLSLLFFAGVVILLASVGQYTSYVETEGEIIEALKCNPCEEEDEVVFDRKKNNKEEAVVIAYNVECRTYHLATNYQKPEKQIHLPRNVRVLYNPYFPGDSRLKEGSPFLGSVLVVVSLIGFALMAFLF